MANLEDRITRLEETVWFIEEKLARLDEEWIEQQRQLDGLSRQCEQLKLVMARMREAYEASHMHPSDPPPPHHHNW